MPAPSAPTGFTAVATAFGNQLDWDKQDGLDGFFLYRGLLSNHGDAVIYPVLATYVTDGSGTGYLDAAASSGVHYYYQLQASSLADGESSKVNADVVSAVRMSLTDIRAWIKQYTKQAGSTREYSLADLDRAFQSVANDFLRTTRLVTAAVDATLSSGDSLLSFAVAQPFAKEQIIDVHLYKDGAPDGRLEIRDWNDVQERRRCNPTTTGRPCIGGSRDSSGGIDVYPLSDAGRTATLRYWQLLTPFVAGTASDATTFFNIPDQYLEQILPDGPPALLMRNVKEYSALAVAAQARYEATRTRMMGAGNMGERVIIRKSLRDLERERRWG